MDIFIQRDVPGFERGWLYATDTPINQETGESVDPEGLLTVVIVLPPTGPSGSAIGLVEDSAIDLWVFLGGVLKASGALDRLKDGSTRDLGQ